MRLVLTGRNLDVTPALRQLVTRRLAKLQRIMNDSLVSSQVVLSLKKFHHLSEVTVHARGDHVLHGVGDGASWQSSLKEAVEKIEQQATTVKGKWAERKRRSTRAKSGTRAETTPEATDGQRVVRRRRYAVKPMSLEDAAAKVEGGKDPFLVFRNASTDAVNIVYRRTDGQVGLIDPDA